MTLGKDPLLGETVGGYKLEEELGRGGMAAVYKALQLNLDRYVAIKILLAHLASDTEFVRRFQQEARAAASLKHPNIVTIYDVGRDISTDSYYIAMEYIEGESLKERLERSGAILPIRAMDILRPLASALDHAHEKGFVHRDIKSSNILIETGTGRAVLTDFGVAKALHEGSSMTQTGAFIGTVYYAAPEQVQGQAVDQRADLYAFGVLAYEVLSGRVPFSGNTMSVLYAQVHMDPPPIHEKNVALPGNVDIVLGRMMAKRPGDRYETASAFVEELGRALAGKSVLVQKVPSSKAVVAGMPKRKRGKKKEKSAIDPGPRRSKVMLWAGFMVVIVAVGLGALVAFGKGGAASSRPRPTEVRIVTATQPVTVFKDIPTSGATSTTSGESKVIVRQPTAPVVTDTPVTLPTVTPTVVPTEMPTQTATPTDTPTPTPTPTWTVSLSSLSAEVNVNKANVREGPGVMYRVVRQYRQGAVLQITGRTEDGAWLSIIGPDGMAGWISAGIVNITGDMDTLLVVTVQPPTPTNTPRPTATPRPTNTPRPANTPRPENTPRPTNTPRPPTNTPVPPTWTPRPLPTTAPTWTPRPLPTATPTPASPLPAP